MIDIIVNATGLHDTVVISGLIFGAAFIYNGIKTEIKHFKLKRRFKRSLQR